MNGEESSHTARSHGHHGSSRLAWILVLVLGGLLLAALKPSVPLDISISWNPKPAQAGSSPDRLDGSDSMSALRNARLEEDTETGPDLMERPRADSEDNWSDSDRPQRRSGTRQHPPLSQRGGVQRNRATGWDDAYEERGDASRTRDDDWTEPGTVKASSRPRLHGASGWEDAAAGSYGDREADESRGLTSTADGWATEEPERGGESTSRARKSDPALLRAGDTSIEDQPASPETPPTAVLPRASMNNPPPAGDPARIAQAVEILAAPIPEIVPAPQAPPGSVDPPVGATSPQNTNTTATTADPQPDPSKASADTVSAPGSSPDPVAGNGASEKAPDDPDVRGASCPTCGGSGRMAGSTESCLSCGGRGTCFPGQKACDPIQAHTAVGRFFANLYECLCCPDPCYQPSWIPEANAAFFVDYARPQTVTRFRYDYMPHLEFPDRNEYWWAQSMYNYQGKYKGKGPMPPLLVGPRGSIVRGWSYLNMNVGSFYTEAAAKRASFFVEIPYESFNAYPSAPNSPPNIGALRHSAGFSDMNIGTKSLLLDCELIQLTFQFRTYFPIGNVTQGLGNGHISLEPSLLTTIKLGPETYFQGQLAEWIPIGGDQSYAGAILKYGFAFNQVLYRLTPGDSR